MRFWHKATFCSQIIKCCSFILRKVFTFFVLLFLLWLFNIKILQWESSSVMEVVQPTLLIYFSGIKITEMSEWYWFASLIMFFLLAMYLWTGSYKRHGSIRKAPAAWVEDILHMSLCVAKVHTNILSITSSFTAMVHHCSIPMNLGD